MKDRLDPRSRSPELETRKVKEVLEYCQPENPWVRLYFDIVQFPNGKIGRCNRIVEGVNGRGVVAVPITRGQEIGLVSIYRYPIGKWQYELPRGYSEPDLSPRQNVARELSEEMGIDNAELIQLGTLYPNTGLLATEIDVFLAHNVVPPHLDRKVEIEAIAGVSFHNRERVKELILKGSLGDCISLGALNLAVVSGYWSL